METEKRNYVPALSSTRRPAPIVPSEPAPLAPAAIVYTPQRAAEEHSSHTDRAQAIVLLTRPLALAYGTAATALTLAAAWAWPSMPWWGLVATWLALFSAPLLATSLTAWWLQLAHTGPGVERLRIKAAERTERHRISVETAARERMYGKYLESLEAEHGERE